MLKLLFKNGQRYSGMDIHIRVLTTEYCVLETEYVILCDHRNKILEVQKSLIGIPCFLNQNKVPHCPYRCLSNRFYTIHAPKNHSFSQTLNNTQI